MTRRESVLSALHDRLVAALGPVKVERNDILPQRVPADGLVILRDGEAGEGEALLSPPSWYFEHRAELEVIVDGADAAARDAGIDTLVTAIGVAIDNDRTLGGVCDWCQGLAPSILEIPVDGGAPLRGATVPVVLAYVSADPLA